MNFELCHSCSKRANYETNMKHAQADITTWIMKTPINFQDRLNMFYNAWNKKKLPTVHNENYCSIQSKSKFITFMLAIDFPRKKRIFIMNSMSREMISDIFLTNNLSKLSKISFIFRQIFTNNFIRK